MTPAGTGAIICASRTIVHSGAEEKRMTRVFAFAFVWLAERRPRFGSAMSRLIVVRWVQGRHERSPHMPRAAPHPYLPPKR